MTEIKVTISVRNHLGGVDRERTVRHDVMRRPQGRTAGSGRVVGGSGRERA
ncbi:MAG: hypothetical protein MUP13_07670 [Thermoanaerobaculales bacterium]|nr:hypothetical protein [Thermoanaerobaculales bacterium]